MSKPKIAVVYLPGNNCEKESLRAIQANDMDSTIVRWNQIKGIEKYDGYFVVGGWAYEDRIRAGAIGAKDPIIQKIKEQSNSGKPVLGVCNGCQVLVEAGMIPGLQNNVQMALASNNNPLVDGYYCSWVHIKNVQEKKRSVFTTAVDRDEVMQVPVAHGEGRFVTSDEDLLNELEKNNQIIFKYCTEKGDVDASFPTNPNGAMENIAGMCNKEGNVLAMMPHPERANTLARMPYTQQKISGKEDLGQFTPANKIFESLKEWFDK